jgi:S-adenosylmethionine hydrolase
MIISLTTDFGSQTQSIGVMEGTIAALAPQARVIHLMHGLPPYDTIAAARTMETIRYLPIGCHICVCDPGVGTERRAIICQVGRGDSLIGPDNGALIPATRILGGITAVHEITNTAYMLEPVSPIFHGRDIFAPAAAHLANGEPIAAFGPAIDAHTLVSAAYTDAVLDGNTILATAIQINRYGSVHLNILHELWDSLNLVDGREVSVYLPSGAHLELPVGRTFASVSPQRSLILKDDYGRVEVATNLGSFVEKHPIEVGDFIRIVI